MNLRPYSASDQEELERFIDVMYVSRGYRFDPKGLHADLSTITNTYQTPGGQFWIFNLGGIVIGTIGIKILDPLERIGEIKRFFVLSEYQGKGLGKELMENAIYYAKEINLKKLRLDTMRNSVKALSVFKKYGFYEIPKYNDNAIAEVFMELELETHAV